MFSLDIFKRTYDVETHDLMIRGRKFSYFLPRSIEPFIDLNSPLKDFPLWAKVWPSSMVLADFMAAQATDPEKRILEIGSGIGIVGIAARAFGHNITITEYNTDAMEFAGANAFINGCSGAPIVSMNWNMPQISSRYDQIIGSEVIFREQDFVPIQKLFQSVLKPDGEIILVSEIRKPVLEFYQKMKGLYELKVQQKVLRAENEEIRIILCRMKPKPIVSQITRQQEV
jgi:predicted nicotinamide N-methyase